MGRFAAAIVCLCAFLGAAGSADAQYFGRNKVHYARLQFRVLQTDHFDIYYYPEEEAATRQVARMAERWYARFAELLGHRFTKRQPLVLYASHPHFGQTNITSASPAEGVGGLTERAKSRIVMPFAAGLGETNHVLGHEIAHAFQIDIARTSGQSAFALPGWFIEGMAEYLSLGPANTHTMMWLRDAALDKKLPTLKQLDNPRYFPYRYGHALWSYLATRFGDEIIGLILKSKVRGVLPKLADATAVDIDQLTRDWHASISLEDPRDGDRSSTASRIVIGGRNADGRVYVSPAISPDGRRLMFLSERDRLSLDLFMADAATGQITTKIISTAADPHFDSLQYIHSAGAWDATGRRFAMAAISGGHPVLMIVDTMRATRRRETPLPDFGEIYNPSWSPDGTRIVFAAIKGGFSDLFLYTVATGGVEQLTADGFADLHPTWSPDGRTIAFATDRFTTSLEDLSFGALRIGLLDLGTHAIEPLLADEDGVKQVSPQWAPDGSALYFVSDRGGISNVFRFELSSGTLRKVTNVATGVTGITATSPALAVASSAGTVAFSVYRNGRYDIEAIGREEAESAPPITTLSEGMSAEKDKNASSEGLASLLANARFGLPGQTEFPSKTYDDRLRLESVAPPFVGAISGNAFGGIIRSTFGFSFGDTLRDRDLRTFFRVGTDADDFAAQVAYTNRRERWNWGLTAGFVPARFLEARRAINRIGDLVTRETTHLRYLHEWGGVTAHYNVDRAHRLEFSAGVRRTGFQWQTITRVTDPVQRKTLSRVLDETPAGKPVYLTETQAAFVTDTAVTGPTGPLLGHRLRIEVEPALGGLSFADVRVDVRRYWMPLRRVTVAARVEHVGRYGPDAADPRLTPLVLGLQTLVRGYDLRSFAAEECGRAARECSLTEELTGSRLALMNLELRAPLFGLFTGNLDYGPLPLEALAFVDAGLLWTRHPGSPSEQDRFRSVGAGGRANVGGIVFEVTAARLLDRAQRGWTTSILLRPGF
jgi:Tol biopolymer transport system component